jgi:hypothetical protein
MTKEVDYQQRVWRWRLRLRPFASIVSDEPLRDPPEVWITLSSQ